MITALVILTIVLAIGVLRLMVHVDALEKKCSLLMDSLEILTNVVQDMYEDIDDMYEDLDELEEDEE